MKILKTSFYSPQKNTTQKKIIKKEKKRKKLHFLLFTCNKAHLQHEKKKYFQELYHIPIPFEVIL